MNPIGDFFVEFTTKGLGELKEGLKDLNKSLDGLSADFDANSKASGNFFGKFKGWATSIGLVAAAIWGVHKALKETFQVSKEIRGLYKSSDMLGVDPSTLEKWTLVARLHDGNQGDVTSFFSGLNQMALNLKEGKYSQELVERMARYGFNEQYLYNASLPENRDKLIGDLNRLLNRKDLNSADIQALQAVFPGLNDTMVSILKTLPKDLAAQLEWADRRRVLSKDDKYLKDSVSLNKATIEVQQAFKEAWLPLIEPLANLINALEPLAEPLKSLVEGIGELLTALNPIVAYVVQKLGGSLTYVIDAIRATLKGPKAFEEFDRKYSQPGTGGWLGSTVRGFDDLTASIGNAIGNAIAPEGTTVTIDLDSLPTGPTSDAVNSMNQATVDAVLKASIEVLNNGVPAQDRGDGIYTDGRTGAPVGRVAWATSVQ